MQVSQIFLANSLVNFSSGIIGKRPFWAKSWPGGGHGSGEVTGGHGRLR